MAASSSSSTQVKRRFECSVCQRKFSRPTSLRRHVLGVHARYMPHVCRYGCGYRSSEKHNLKRHEMTHEKNGALARRNSSSSSSRDASNHSTSSNTSARSRSVPRSSSSAFLDVSPKHPSPSRDHSQLAHVLDVAIRRKEKEDAEERRAAAILTETRGRSKSFPASNPFPSSTQRASLTERSPAGRPADAAVTESEGSASDMEAGDQVDTVDVLPRGRARRTMDRAKQARLTSARMDQGAEDDSDDAAAFGLHPPSHKSKPLKRKRRKEKRGKANKARKAADHVVVNNAYPFQQPHQQYAASQVVAVAPSPMNGIQGHSAGAPPAYFVVMPSAPAMQPMSVQKGQPMIHSFVPSVAQPCYMPSPWMEPSAHTPQARSVGQPGAVMVAPSLATPRSVPPENTFQSAGTKLSARAGAAFQPPMRPPTDAAQTASASAGSPRAAHVAPSALPVAPMTVMSSPAATQQQASYLAPAGMNRHVSPAQHQQSPQGWTSVPSPFAATKVQYVHVRHV